MEFAHRSVLLHECIDALAIKPDGIYLDGTLGGAGHSLEICRSLTTGRLIGVDRDLVALEAAKKRLYRHAKKVTLVHDNFENVGAILTALGLDRIDGMLFDLGVSSPQLDDAERGFSYMADAPLDMRMDREQSLTAYEIVNNWPREELKSILYEYGEERYAPQIAAAIERVRTDRPPGHGGRDRPSEARRPSRRHHLPFARRPHRQKCLPGRGQGLYLPAVVPGLCLRPQAEDPDPDEKTHHRHARGGRGKPPFAQRKAPRRRARVSLKGVRCHGAVQ